MVKPTITGAEVTSNGVWFELDDVEEAFVTRTALVEGFDGLGDSQV
jgi:hypothetical protein